MGLTISDGEGMVAAAPCALDNPHTAVCPIGADVPVIVIKSADGNDRVVQGINMILFSRIIDWPRPIAFNGGPGNDLLQGGLGPDALRGGTGRDQLLGLDGDDLLIGAGGAHTLDGGTGNDGSNLGRDRYFGGTGPDRICSRDFTRDRRIDCGPGRDSLQRDRFDPKPSGCP